MSYTASDDQIAETQQMLVNTKIIIIDESSFIGINTLCVLDYILCRVRQAMNKSKDISPEPFGGFQIIMFGDYQQLKCVGDFEVFKPQSTQTVNEMTEAMEIIENAEDGIIDPEEFEANRDQVTNKQIEEMYDMGGKMQENGKTEIQIMDTETKKKTKLAQKKQLIQKRIERYYSTL